MRMRDLIGIVESAARPKMRPDAADVARIEHARHMIRWLNGGGGYCHEVSDWIEDTFGWPRFSGAYTDTNDDTICDAHVWNILPDGAILDSTADQFGEGHSVRVIEPDDPEMARYRPEWFDDYYPGHPLWPELAGRKWSGEFDGDRANRLRDERGDGWWLKDRAAYDAYLQQWDRYHADLNDPKIRAELEAYDWLNL